MVRGEQWFLAERRHSLRGRSGEPAQTHPATTSRGGLGCGIRHTVVHLHRARNVCGTASHMEISSP